jgi:hypothetical protein
VYIVRDVPTTTLGKETECKSANTTLRRSDLLLRLLRRGLRKKPNVQQRLADDTLLSETADALMSASDRIRANLRILLDDSKAHQAAVVIEEYVAHFLHCLGQLHNAPLVCEHTATWLDQTLSQTSATQQELAHLSARGLAAS